MNGSLASWSFLILTARQWRGVHLYSSLQEKCHVSSSNIKNVQIHLNVFDWIISHLQQMFDKKNFTI